MMRIEEITNQKLRSPIDAQSAALKRQAQALKQQRMSLQLRKARERMLQATKAAAAASSN